MQCVRQQDVACRVAEAGEHPQRAERDRRDRKPAPQPCAREHERGGCDHREVEVERPVVRGIAGDQHRCDERADLPQCGKRGSVQQRGGKRRERHDTEQDECRARYEKIVQRISRIDRRIGDGRSCGRENARDVRGGYAGKACQLVVAARPFTGPDEGSGKQPAEENAHAWANQSRLDRELHQENAAEREREPADPHDPACTEALLEALARRGRFWGRGRGGRRGLRDTFADCALVHALRRHSAGDSGGNEWLLRSGRRLERSLRCRLNSTA